MLSSRPFASSVLATAPRLIKPTSATKTRSFAALAFRGATATRLTVHVRLFVYDRPLPCGNWEVPAHLKADEQQQSLALKHPLLEKLFQVKWKIPSLRKHLLMALSTNPPSTQNEVDVLVCEIRKFSSQSTAGDVAKAHASSMANKDETHIAKNARLAVERLLESIKAWLQKFEMLKTTPSMIRDSLDGLIKLKRIDRKTGTNDDPLVDMQLATSSLTAMLENRFDVMLDKDSDRRKLRPFLVSTLPGSGKTRLCTEFVKRIAPAVFRRRGIVPLCLYVSFNDSEWTTPKANPEHALSTRLLTAYFKIPPRFFEDKFEQTGSFQVAATLQFIQEFEYSVRNGGRQPTSQDQLPWLAIAVDDIDMLPRFLTRSKQDTACSYAQRQQHLLKSTFSSLKDAVMRPEARLFVLYSGSYLSAEHLTAGLAKPSDSGTSNVDVDSVPMYPFHGAHIALFADVVQESGSWRNRDRKYVSRLYDSGGVPGHIKDAFGLDLRCVPLRPDIRTLIELVHFCSFDASSINLSSLASRFLAWIGTGCAFVACDTANKGSMQFNLRGDLKLDLTSGRDVPPICHHLAETLACFLKTLSRDLQFPPPRSSAWELLVVNLFNVRVTAFLAKTVLDQGAAPLYIDVPLSQVLPGVTFGLGCDKVKLRLSPRDWSSRSGMKLTEYGANQVLDSYMQTQVVQTSVIGSEKVGPGVIGLQLKLHSALHPTEQDMLKRLATNVRDRLADDSEKDTVKLVGIMLPSRGTNAKPPPLSWVLQRADLDQFAQGFQVAVKSTYSFDPHHSLMAHIASSLYSFESETTGYRPSQLVCMALARLLVQQRKCGSVFRTAQDLRNFLLQKIGQSVKVSWTEGMMLTKFAPKSTGPAAQRFSHVLYPEDVPPLDVLHWYFALPDEQATSSPRSTEDD
ncbi:hypothetical protein CAOG_05015 [Capsaspora owczarzaki ATCC 30864]|uniref:hypothetical protein n=1 Tax=Capsaspora owczarzaki (strain ATCC 30864) TaxID=595528 RepID=UPI0003521A8D|nr:hypothetical protein CAOG_05015 [Capsaspora owczarzaki ATCC 30864]|eukprot:XP_004346700.2 hypothetical protein CAOG_05015 [Capsaspora owczarzaki ATCC 30864]